MRELITQMSLPTRERGLKHIADRMATTLNIVAPYTGAWIETSISTLNVRDVSGRSLHGSVD